MIGYYSMLHIFCQFDFISVKSPFPTQACLRMGIRTWDTPKHEEEVGQGPHEFRMVGRIAGAIRDNTFIGQLMI